MGNTKKVATMNDTLCTVLHTEKSELILHKRCHKCKKIAETIYAVYHMYIMRIIYAV